MRELCKSPEGGWPVREVFYIKLYQVQVIESEEIQPQQHLAGMVADVRWLCQQCLQYQWTSPYTSSPPTIIGVPFERIGMDIRVPIPKSAQDHEYILIILDYATCYPEAVLVFWLSPMPHLAFRDTFREPKPEEPEMVRFTSDNAWNNQTYLKYN